jgi:putative IMPACT (imprinted ancient) family translation regulator
MKELSAGKLLFKNSRFFGHLYYIDNEEEIKIILNLQRELYNKANHHCYAVYLFNGLNPIVSYFKNDGEVGQPGKILHELLKKYDLNNNIIVVSRIFGGIKLGVGGVTKSFKEIGESIISLYISKNS